MPIKPRCVFLFWGILWLAQLYLLPQYFIRTQALGYYPVHADSIGIPVLGVYFMVIFLGPILAVVLWQMVRRPEPKSLTWTAWCHERWGWSLTWTLVFGYLCYTTVRTFVENIAIDLPLNALADVGWLYVHLALRAIVVARLNGNFELESPPAGTSRPREDPELW